MIIKIWLIVIIFQHRWKLGRLISTRLLELSKAGTPRISGQQSAQRLGDSAAFAC